MAWAFETKTIELHSYLVMLMNIEMVLFQTQRKGNLMPMPSARTKCILSQAKSILSQTKKYCPGQKTFCPRQNILSMAKKFNSTAHKTINMTSFEQK